MLTRKKEIINIIIKHITHHLTAIYAFTNHKQSITSLFKNSKHHTASDKQILNKKTAIVDSIKAKVNKKIALATKVAVPAP
jgi:hypothetical protein